MGADRKTAVVVGALFLTAMVASILGGSLVDSIVTDADLKAAHTHEGGIVVGVLLELVNCAAVVGIGVALLPVLRRYGQVSAVGYVAFRSIEAALLAVAAMVPLAILALSRDAAAGGDAGTPLDSLGPVLLSLREQIYGLGVVTFFCLGAALLYSVLYRSRLVPRFIPIWGLVGVVTVFALNLLDALGRGETTGVAIVLALPIITNEVFLGLWLIFKGFDQTAPAAEAASLSAAS